MSAIKDMPRFVHWTNTTEIVISGSGGVLSEIHEFIDNPTVHTEAESKEKVARLTADYAVYSNFWKTEKLPASFTHFEPNRDRTGTNLGHGTHWRKSTREKPGNITWNWSDFRQSRNVPWRRPWSLLLEAVHNSRPASRYWQRRTSHGPNRSRRQRCSTHLRTGVRTLLQGWQLFCGPNPVNSVQDSSPAGLGDTDARVGGPGDQRRQ